MKYTDIIREFFLINDSPSDAQIHKLAEALGVDKEELEAEIFEITGFIVNVNAAMRLGTDPLSNAEGL